jgi:hypothetical protein
LPEEEQAIMDRQPKELPAEFMPRNREFQSPAWTSIRWGVFAAVLGTLIVSLIAAFLLMQPAGTSEPAVQRAPAPSAVPLNGRQPDPLEAAVHHGAVVVRNAVWAGVALAFFGLMCRMIGAWMAEGPLTTFNYHHFYQRARRLFAPRPHARTDTLLAVDVAHVVDVEPEADEEDKEELTFLAARSEKRLHGGT